VSSEQMDEVERQRAGDGIYLSNYQLMRSFLMTLLNENEELLEDLARNNVTDVAALRQRVCVTGSTPICKGLTLQDMEPRDLNEL